MVNMLSVHKELAKKAHAESDLGKLEKRISQFWDNVYLKDLKLPQEFVDKVNKIRTDNEQAQLDYIEKTNKEHREWIDQSLKKAMSEEAKLLDEFESTANSNNGI